HGDKIIPIGFQHEKKIKDILINEKIQKEIREQIPIILTISDEIVWVAGVKGSDKYKRKTTDIEGLTLKIRRV
ncbi:MAG: tRNA lysidine(34) synthetase TilS, partial [Fusobacteriaceae bacterium]